MAPVARLVDLGALVTAAGADVVGSWWLPGHEDHKVPGTLTFSQESGGSLRLHGLIRPPIEQISEDGQVEWMQTFGGDAETYPRIHGEAGGVLYNLEDCFQRSMVGLFSSDAKETIHVNAYIAGAHFESGNGEPEFDRAVASLRHLTSWTRMTGLEIESEPAEAGKVRYAATASFIAEPRIELPDGWRLRLRHWLGSAGDRYNSVSLTQEWQLVVERDDTRPASEFIAIVGYVQNLVSTAAGITADIERVQMEHPYITYGEVTGSEARRPVEYVAQWQHRSAPGDEISKQGMLFYYSDLGEASGLQRWLQIAFDFRSEIGRVMATRYNKSMFLEDRVMNVAAALESLDTVRRSTGKKKVFYLDRLKACADFAGEPFDTLLGEPSQDWAVRARDSRNDLAHHRDGLRLRTGSVDYLLSEQLYWLFLICIFRLSDPPPQFWTSLQRHRRYTGIREMAQDRLRELATPSPAPIPVADSASTDTSE